MSSSLNPDDVPDVQRCCQCEHQTGEEDGWCRPFELSLLAIVEVRHPKFGEEKYSEDQVDGWEYHVVDHVLDLDRGIIPSGLYRRCHISCARSKGWAGEGEGEDKNNAEKGANFHKLFHKNRLSNFND